MQPPSPQRVLQWLISLTLLTFIITSWNFNQVGQLIINITAVLMFIVGLDNILIYYRCYKEKSSFENQGTFVLFCLFMVGMIFQSFNKSYGVSIVINVICKYCIIGVLGLNFSYYAFVLIILICYLIRQIYRLMSQTLLSANTQINHEHLTQFIQQNKHLYQQTRTRVPGVNNSCSICLIQFENDNFCVLLPNCQHCFHEECIQEWLSNKATCPYCRHNIQLDMDMDIGGGGGVVADE